MTKGGIAAIAISGCLLVFMFVGLFSHAVKTENAVATSSSWTKEEVVKAFKQRDDAIEIIIKKVNEHESRLQALEPKKASDGKEKKAK